jgi:hypothetical protein
VIVEAGLSDWRSGDCKQLAVYVQNASDWQYLDSSWKLRYALARRLA